MSENVLQKMIHMEEKFKLLELKCGNFHPWGYIRWETYTRLEKDFQEVAGVQFGSSLREKLAKFKTFRRQCRHHRTLLPCEILFISHPRRFFADGLHKCIYTDDLAGLYGERGFTSEGGFVHSTPAYTKRLYFSDHRLLRLLLSEMVFAKLGNILLHKTERRLLYHAAARIHSAIEEEFRLDYSQKDIFHTLVYSYLLYLRDIRRNKALLKKTHPRVIVEVVGYTKANMAMNEAARGMGILVIELQHGVIGRGHFAYNYGGQKNLPYFPDDICLWGDYWKTSANFPISQTHLISCGYPYLEQLRQKYGSVSKKPEDIVITVLSQPIVAEWIAREILVLISMLKQNKRHFKIFYKLHPSEYDVKYSFLDQLMQENVELIHSNDISVYELFSKSTIQIGAFSTAIFEGLIFNLQTYIIETPKADDYVSDLYRNGYAVLVQNGVELYEEIAAGQTTPSKNFNSNEFFRDHALENLKKFIDGRLID